MSRNTLVTHADGTLHSSQDYCAYGGQRIATQFGYQCNTTVNALPTDRTYTGQEQDTTGLMYFRARMYDPALGTFVSPDTMVPEPGVVFDYNRYMYVRGNNLKYNDPSGHCIFGIDTVICVVAAVAALNVALDYVVTTQVFQEDYTLADGLITAGTSVLMGGTAVGISGVTKAAAKGGAKRLFASGILNAASAMTFNSLNRSAKDYVHGRIVGSSTGELELIIDATAGFLGGVSGPFLDRYIIRGSFDDVTIFVDRGPFSHMFDPMASLKVVIEGKRYVFTSMFGAMSTDSSVFSAFLQWFIANHGREPTTDELYQYGVFSEDSESE